MATEHYPMTESHEEVLFVTNIIVTIIFALEMIIKLIGLGWKGYKHDLFNRFDGIMVILGLIDMIFVSSGLNGLIVLRAFRLLRVFKLARRWTSLRLLLTKMAKSLPTISYLGLLCLLCMFIYSLLGMQFFGGKLKDGDGEPARANFDNLYWSFITIFQIITGENWNEVMYSAIASTNWFASMYFISLLIIGNYILFNLFLAILLQNFEEDEEEEEE